MPKRWRINDVFSVCLLEQDITKKGQIDEKTAKQLEFEAGGNNKKYEVQGICDSAVYARELEASHVTGFYYLVSWKGYSEDENTWESASGVQQHRKLVSTFHKNLLDKLKATSPPINLAPPMAKSTAPPNVNGKRKRSRPVSSVRKRAKH